MVNLKSRIKPFQIFEMECNFSVFAYEHRKEVSHFPWWNHWPVAQIPSDGRYCQAADRASHFSLAWASPRPHKGENNTYSWAWMYGATQDNAESLVPLARSWLLPPKLIVETGATSSRYDLTQRCYVISRSKGCGGENLRFRLEADFENPIVNPAFVITNWGNWGAMLQVNGKAVPRDKAFRFGHVRRINQYDLVVWIQLESDQTVEISLSPKEE